MSQAQAHEAISRRQAEYEHWEKVKDLVDQLVDITMNYRQSGHPGGSRSKVYMLIALLLGGAMRWDIRHPEKRFGDHFVLAAGHTAPLIYCTLAVLNEALRVKYRQTKDPVYLVDRAEERALYWEDLLTFRRRGGLPGHPEMAGKTLFIKFNTGPTGHGAPAAAGIALALKRAGAQGVRVFVIEGEAGLSAGGSYETMNSAWGLGLDNLHFIVDWNDFGIDDHPVSSSMYGTPSDWFAAHGWRAFACETGDDWGAVDGILQELVADGEANRAPKMACIKTRKGRGYLKYDNQSHGSPHPIDSELFWETKRPFAEKYGVQFSNFGCCAPADPAQQQAEFRANLEAVIDVLRRDGALVDYLADRLIELGESVPAAIDTFTLERQASSSAEHQVCDYRNYPADLYVEPGTKIANRAALAKWGAWVNALAAREYGRPLFLAAAADLAESTNLSGFAKRYGDFPGYGWYERHGSSQGVLLPQEITEFANAGILAGMASVNFASDPEQSFVGFWGACATYGAFSYLKYGPFRLFSQLAQDCAWRVGKLLWIVGHSGPETAEDSRTHFGIFEPGVTQLFPKGQVINLHPWEYNEVPVLLGAALHQPTPIVALHLTRPPIEIPDRSALGWPSHFEAARGAYVLRDYLPNQPRGGTLIVEGTSAMTGLGVILPELSNRHLNVKIVYAASRELFDAQPKEYQEQVLPAEDRIDSTIVTTQARILMSPWLLNPEASSYALSADWDQRWRSGGTVAEILDEAHLSPAWMLAGIERFVDERSARLGRLQAALSPVTCDQTILEPRQDGTEIDRRAALRPVV